MTTSWSPVPMLVVTGGPCAGKSNVLKAVELLHGDKIEFVPEAATQIREEGFPDPPDDPTARRLWLVEFQLALATRILLLENAAQQKALELGKPLIVTDRGLGDGLAYHPDGPAALVQTKPLVHHKLTHPRAILNRYHAVIHMESLAVHHPEQYQTQNNTARYETVEQARATDQAVANAWHGHRNWKLVCNEYLDFAGVNNAVLAEIKRTLRSIQQRTRR